jgi:hypothetical protein
VPEPVTDPAHGVADIHARIQQRAERLGKSAEAVIADDLQALRSAAYPGAECLTPYEVADFVELSLPEDRLAHVEACPLCAAMLDAARPTERAEQAFAEACQRILVSGNGAAAAPARRKWRIPEPLVDVLAVQVTAIVGALALVGFSISKAEGVLESILLSQMAERYFIVVLPVAVALAAVVAVVNRYIEPRPRAFAYRSGGALAGGLFTVFMVGYAFQSSSDYAERYAGIQAAENALLAVVAQGEGMGFAAPLAMLSPSLRVTVENGAAHARSAAFNGALVAEPSSRGGELLWKGNRDHKLGTIYQGVLESDMKGGYKVRTGDGSFAVSLPSLDGLLGVGEHVITVVPANGTDALKLYPVEPQPADRK